ncbi:MAG: LuxR family transcriptional regulator [Frankiales bacterium]|nr:LuxR family transcriptional regulator [Frankiales bacterium]
MADVAAFSETLRPPLVGREEELQLLLDAVRACAEGRPAAVLLGGDAGVGKTRLLAQLLEELPTPAMVLRGGCVDLGDVGLAYLPFVEAFSDLARQHPSVVDVPGLGPLLPSGAGQGGELARLQLFEAVVTALRSAGEVAPVVLVLEDLHWADASSRELLRFLLTRLRDERVAVLASYRADDLHRRHPLVPLVAELSRLSSVEHLQLNPLRDDDVRRHLRSLVPEAVPENLLSAVVTRAEGNPYFAEELLLAAVDTGDLDGRVLPHRLSEVLLARLERLDESTLAVVRLAAVAGRRVEHELLAAACLEGGLPAEAALRDAVAGHVLVVTPGRAAGSYSFRHALLQETVYDDLLPGERVRLHGLLASVLTSYGGAVGPGELGVHRERSGDLTGALEDYLAAGTAAMVSGAPHEALALRERALELVAAGAWPGITDQDRADLMRDGADAAGLAGDWGRAIALAKARVAAVEGLGSAEQSEARRTLASHLLAGDRESDAQQEATRARTLAYDAAEPAGIARAEALYARTVWRSLDRDDEVRDAAERALAAALAAGLSDVQADALVTLGTLAEASGDSVQALESFRRARDLAVEHGHLLVELRAAFNAAAHSFYAADLEVAAAEVDAAAARADAVGLGWSAYGYSVRGMQSVIRYTRGDLAGSTAASTTVTGAADPARESLAAIGLYAAVARGDDGVIERALRVAGIADVDPMALMIAAGTGADALRMAGEPERASALAAEGAARIAERWGEWSLGGIWLAALGIAAEADLAQRARERKDAVAEQAAVEKATRWDQVAQETASRGRPRGGVLGPEGRAWLLRSAAELQRARGRNDPDRWRAVVAEFDYGYAYEVARSRWRLAEALVGVGDRVAAAEELQAAARTAVALGTVPLQQAVTDLARRARLDLGEALVVGRVAVASLTAREQEVLRLVASGLTNRQIGAQLFISEKTASVHVSRILAKLAVSGRAEAAARAAHLGLV